MAAWRLQNKKDSQDKSTKKKKSDLTFHSQGLIQTIVKLIKDNTIGLFHCFYIQRDDHMGKMLPVF